jgi:hypothetical protein
MFENSTVCHAIFYVVVICFVRHLGFWVSWVFGKSNDSGVYAGLFVLLGFKVSFMESLILAQDERWRRA